MEAWINRAVEMLEEYESACIGGLQSAIANEHISSNVPMTARRINIEYMELRVRRVQDLLEEIKQEQSK